MREKKCSGLGNRFVLSHHSWCVQASNLVFQQPALEKLRITVGGTASA